MWQLSLKGYRPSANMRLSLGANFTLNNIKSIHAEQDAINKLKPNFGRPIKANIMVIKFGMGENSCDRYELKNSYPCVHCLYSIYVMALKRGYKICHIFYSDHRGEIQCEKIGDLIHKDNQYITPNNWRSQNFAFVRRMEKMMGKRYTLQLSNLDFDQ